MQRRPPLQEHQHPLQGRHPLHLLLPIRNSNYEGKEVKCNGVVTSYNEEDWDGFLAQISDKTIMQQLDPLPWYFNNCATSLM